MMFANCVYVIMYVDNVVYWAYGLNFQNKLYI